MNSDSKTKVHNGGCHRKSVRWKAVASPNVVTRTCYCSYCLMRGSTLFAVPAKKFELLGDSDKFITTYTFGSHATKYTFCKACSITFGSHATKYTFCKACSITSFYYPRSNPGWVAVSCTSVEIELFDGGNWKKSYHRIGNASNSKVQK